MVPRFCNDSPCGKSNVLIYMSVEYWWNDTDRGKLKSSKENLSQYYFVQHKSHMHWPGIERRVSAVSGGQLIAWSMARPFKHLKIQSYRAVNTPRLSYKNQPVNVVQ